MAKAPGATAIVFDATGKKVLCTKREDLPVWVFPGGGIDLGETPEEAVVREIFEETGLIVAVERRIGHYLPYGVLFTDEVYLFECRVVSGTLTPSSETPEVGFYPLDKLPSPFFTLHRYWLQDALARYPVVLEQKESRANLFQGFLFLLKHPLIALGHLWKLFQKKGRKEINDTKDLKE